MEAIYAKIQATEEHLRNLRSTLEAAEVSYKAKGPFSRRPTSLAAVTLPFVESACASAKAAFLSSGTHPR